MKCLVNQIKTAGKHHVGKRRVSGIEDKVKEILHSDIMCVTEREKEGWKEGGMHTQTNALGTLVL